MFQLRIYTLRSPEALQRYATVHWARRLATFETSGSAPTVCGHSDPAVRTDSSR